MTNLAVNLGTKRVMDAVAAGTSDQTGLSVDMAGFDGCVFIAVLGELSSNQETSMKIQQSSDDGSADAFADLLGTDSGDMEDDDDDQLIIIDINRPLERYLRPILLRATGNAVIDGIIALPYKTRKAPETKGATVFAEATFASPAEGTA